jgi:hypothetical protein
MTTSIPPEYAIGDDFGFTAIDDPTAGLPVESQVNVPAVVMNTLADITDALSRIEQTMVKPSSVEPADILQARLKDVERLVMPLLVNLTKNPEKEYILWPKRKEQIDVQIEKLLKLTRG